MKFLCLYRKVVSVERSVLTEYQEDVISVEVAQLNLRELVWFRMMAHIVCDVFDVPSGNILLRVYFCVPYAYIGI